MAHNNNTPANIITAPLQTTFLVAGVQHETNKKGEIVHSEAVATGGYKVNSLTGQITNPKKRAAKNRRAAEKRVARRNRNSNKV
jgi:hypothetical protein